ncbi:MAG: ABC transporter substrate-binding protein [Lachnospiraceae bacterium]|nr:ABC transporter substrate-binding protein [Lachnospiraceae bacterium]
MKAWKHWMAAGVMALLLAGCGSGADGSAEAVPAVTAEESVTETPAQAAEEVPEAAAGAEAAEVPEATPGAETAEDVTEVRVGSLKGPTSIGILDLMQRSASGETADTYSFTMETQADALLPSLISGELDIALLPANVASVLYHKTEGGLQVIDINTLGVLYLVSGDESIQSIADLAGHTVYTTGKGTTPEYVLNWILDGNGLRDEVEVSFCSEAAEVAALLAEQPTAAGVLPQPFATVALAKNNALSIVADLTKEWEALDPASALVTGVSVVRAGFLEEHPAAVERFLAEHEVSVAYAVAEPKETAERMVAQGIMENADLAQASLPYCNLVCITGEEMKQRLSSYLQVLEGADPAAVGGALPGEDFYYLAE